MAKTFKENMELTNFQKVGYTLTKREASVLQDGDEHHRKPSKKNGVWYVRFTSPSGEYMRLSTGMKEEKEARNEARRIIERAYGRTSDIAWDELLTKLEIAQTANRNRPGPRVGLARGGRSCESSKA